MAESKDPGYPLTVYNFQVFVGTVERGGFSECSGLTMDNDIIEYRVGNDPFLSVKKLPGMRKYANIVLKRGFTTDNYLYEWRKRVIEAKPKDNYRQDGMIVLLGEDRQPAIRWKFFEAWPNKLEGPALNAKNN